MASNTFEGNASHLPNFDKCQEPFCCRNVICQTMTSRGDSNYEQQATDVNIHTPERVNVDMASAQQQRHTMARGLVGWLGCSMGVMVWFGGLWYGASGNVW